MNFYQEWLSSALFWLGVCLSFFGIYLLALPKNAIRLAHRMNRWISTDSIFKKLDEPMYREKVFYRWHRLFGTVVIVASAYIMYMFLFHTHINVVAQSLPIFSEKEVNLWLFEALWYFFILVSALLLLVGFIIFVRPSMLKRIESRLNTWVGVDHKLDGLNQSYEIPDNILPGNVRLFGTAVLVGGLYIMYSIQGVLN